MPLYKLADIFSFKPMSILRIKRMQRNRVVQFKTLYEILGYHGDDVDCGCLGCKAA